MTYLSKLKSYNYAFISLFLFITNIILIFATYNNPLTIKWLVILYLIIAFFQMSFIIYIFIKNNIYNIEIEEKSKEYMIFDWFVTLLIPISVFIAVFGTIIAPGKVDGESMMPTLEHKDRIMIYKFKYVPKVGDIVIIHNSNSTSSMDDDLIIKRVIAVPGDKIRFVQTDVVNGQIVGNIYINDILYENNYQGEGSVFKEFYQREYIKMLSHQLVDDEFVDEVVLADNYYLALGDNFGKSSDSRIHGAFHISQIGGKMLFSYGG